MSDHPTTEASGDELPSTAVGSSHRRRRRRRKVPRTPLARTLYFRWWHLVLALVLAAAGTFLAVSAIRKATVMEDPPE